MNQPRSARFPVLGIILILLGAGLLLEQLGAIHLGWDMLFPAGMILLGAGLSLRGIFREGGGKMFVGTLLFLAGLLFLLAQTGLVRSDEHLFLPAFLLIIGISFIMIYAHDPREWGVLIPGGIFVLLSGVFMLAQLDWIQAESVLRFLGLYWPVLLILIGIGMVLRRRPRGVTIGAPESKTSQQNEGVS